MLLDSLPLFQACGFGLDRSLKIDILYKHLYKLAEIT